MPSILQVGESRFPPRTKSLGAAVVDSTTAADHRGGRSPGFFSPELKSWIDNCIVPIMVKEYLTKVETKEELDPTLEPVSNSEERVHPSAEENK